MERAGSALQKMPNVKGLGVEECWRGAVLQVPTSPLYYNDGEAVVQYLPPCGLESQLLAFKDAFSNGGSVLASWNSSSMPWSGRWLGLSFNTIDYAYSM